MQVLEDEASKEVCRRAIRRMNYILHQYHLGYLNLTKREAAYLSASVLDLAELCGLLSSNPSAKEQLEFWEKVFAEKIHNWRW